MEGIKPSQTREVFDGEANVVEEALIGVGDVSCGITHPDALRIQVGEDTVAGLGGGELFFVPLAPGDVGGHAAQVSGNSRAVVDGDAAAFDPEGPALGSEDLIVDDADGVCVDRSFGILLDVDEVGRPDDLVQVVNRTDFGEGASVDGIGAFAEFYGAVDEIHLPCGDASGLLDEGESCLLIEEDLAGDAFGGDVAEEEDDSVLERTALDREPEVERVRVEGLEFTGNAFVHGAEKVTMDFLVLCSDGELLPEIFSEDLPLGA